MAANRQRAMGNRKRLLFAEVSGRQIDRHRVRGDEYPVLEGGKHPIQGFLDGCVSQADQNTPGLAFFSTVGFHGYGKSVYALKGGRTSFCEHNGRMVWELGGFGEGERNNQGTRP